MFEHQIKKYKALNELAEQRGIVIIGGSDDIALPLCELKQAFELSPALYNRSAEGLSIAQAAEYYDCCAADLRPENVFLHLGSADAELFSQNPAEFDHQYRRLIAHIRSLDNACNIALISLKNTEASEGIAEMNRHIKYIAESERCEFFDLSVRRLWNPKETKSVISFLYSTGFVRPLKTKRPPYDLIKILFCFDPAFTA